MYIVPTYYMHMSQLAGESTVVRFTSVVMAIIILINNNVYLAGKK